MCCSVNGWQDGPQAQDLALLPGDYLAIYSLTWRYLLCKPPMGVQGEVQQGMLSDMGLTTQRLLCQGI